MGKSEKWPDRMLVELAGLSVNYWEVGGDSRVSGPAQMPVAVLCVNGTGSPTGTGFGGARSLPNGLQPGA